MDVRAAIERAVERWEPAAVVVEAEPLTGGVSADVFGVVVRSSGGIEQRVVFRRHRADTFKEHGTGVTAKEFALLRAVHGAGLPVPRAYALDPPSMLLEWVDGSTEVADVELAGALDQMAGFLADLHALDPAALGLGDLPRVEDPGGPTNPAAPVALLHCDYWPGNVLWRDGRLVAVIDWEDACLGDPLADLATARVELLCRYDAEAMDRFTARYVELAGADLDGLVAWERYVSAAALASMSSWGLDPTEEAHRRRLTTEFHDRAASRL